MRHITSSGSAGALLLLALVAPALAGGPAPVSTGFDPARHGQPFENRGDFTNNMGNCVGMSLLSIHAFRSGRGAAAPQIVHPPQTADVTRQMVVSIVQAQYLLQGLRDERQRLPVADTAQVRDALERLRQGTPEVMGLIKPGFGHAVVLYGWDGKNLLLYDPNFPGQATRWPWDPEKGLGEHPRYPGLTHVSITPFSGWKVSGQLDALREACSNRERVCVGRFPNIEARMERSFSGQLLVLGQLGAPLLGGSGEGDPLVGGLLWLTIDGRPLGMGRIRAPRGPKSPGDASGVNGVFAVALPRGVKLPGHSVRAVATTRDGRFGGYVDVSVLRDEQGTTAAGASAAGPDITAKIR
jgi:hypothetical protein